VGVHDRHRGVVHVLKRTHRVVPDAVSSPPPFRPPWKDIPKTLDEDYPGSRSALYEEAAEHEGLFRKQGRKTIVDTWMLADIMEQRPVAKIKPSKKSGIVA
jgi:hypothetical protein